VDRAADRSVGLGHHGPGQAGDFLRPEAGSDRQQDDNSISDGVSGPPDVAEKGLDLRLGENLRLFAERHESSPDR
jgi:hypothetical protein